MKAKDMVEGQWYRRTSGEHRGRFTAGRLIDYTSLGEDGNLVKKPGRMCHDDGDRDMQSCFILAIDVEVEPAEPKNRRKL